MKQDTMNSEYSGIRVTDSISLFVPRKINIVNLISVMLIGLCGLIGIVFSFLTMFNVLMDEWKKVLFFTLFFFTVFNVIFMLPGKYKLLFIPVFGVFEYVLYKNWDDFTYGFTIVFNKVYSVIKPKNTPYFKPGEEAITETDASILFIVTAIFIISAVICYATVFRPNFFIGFLITFPFIEIGLYFGKSPEHVFAFMVIIYWACLIVLQYSGFRQPARKKSAGFFRSGSRFTAKPGVKFAASGASGIIMLIISAMIIGISSAILNLTGYERSENLNRIRSDVKIAASEFSFEDLGDSLQKLSEAVGIGNFRDYSHSLGNMNKISFGNKTDLIILSSDAFEDNLYLKGYIGSVYDGKSWDVLDDSDYEEYDRFFSWCKESGEFPQDMLFKSDGLLSVIEGKSVQFKINAKRKNSQYNYVPYNSIPYGNITYINDTIVDLENKKNYKFDVSPDQHFGNIISNYGLENLNDFENQYTEFVMDKYLTVPDNSEMQEVYEKFAYNGETLETTEEKLYYIKSVLSENAEYTLEPGKTPGSNDFVNYFLTKSHKGYCVHFATSGVILSRMLGIPARYTEGYVVSKDDFNESAKQTDGSYKIEIKDNRAHAWAEIYVPGHGWIPYEFTPSTAAALISESVEPAPSASETNTSSSESVKNTSKKNTLTKIKSSERKTTVLSSSEFKTEINNTNTVLNKSEDGLDPIILITGGTVLFIIIFILAVIVKRNIIINIRRKKFNDRNYSDAVVSVYDYILKLLEFEGIELNNSQYMDFAAEAERKSGLFINGEFIRITQTALHAKLSNEQTDIETVESIISAAEKISHMIYEKQSVSGKLKMKFIKNLC